MDGNWQGARSAAPTLSGGRGVRVSNSVSSVFWRWGYFGGDVVEPSEGQVLEDAANVLPCQRDRARL